MDGSRRWSRRALAASVAGMLLLGGTAVARMAPARGADAPPVGETQPVDLRAELRCAAGGAVDFTASVRTTGTVATTVLPGGTVRLHATVSVDLHTDLAATPYSVRYLSGDDDAWWAVGSHYFTTPADPIDMPFLAAVSGPMRIRYGPSPGDLQVALAATGEEQPTIVNCAVVSGNEPVLVPVEVPADGSLQPFELKATATCTTGGSALAPTIHLWGVAPTRVRPGEEAELVANYNGVSSLYFDDLALAVDRIHEGAPAGSSGYSVHTASGARGLHIPLGSSPSEGAMEVRLAGVTGVRAVPPTPGGPHSVPFQCVFAEPLQRLRIEVAGPPVTTTTSTTTSTTAPPTPTDTISTTIPVPTTRPPSRLCRHVPGVPDRIWFRFLAALGVHCP
jgi:hypothetical protein